jgi:hypothetical protein
MIIITETTTTSKIIESGISFFEQAKENSYPGIPESCLYIAH